MAKITIGKVNPVARPSGGAMPNNNGKPTPSMVVNSASMQEMYKKTGIKPPSGRKPNPMKPHLWGTAKPARGMGGITGPGGKSVNPTYNTYP